MVSRSGGQSDCAEDCDVTKHSRSLCKSPHKTISKRRKHDCKQVVAFPAIHIPQCPHYRRNVLIYAACCKRYYRCRQCHDEEVDGSHPDLQKHSVTKLQCTSCGKEQGISARCINPVCDTSFGDRVCLECRLFDSTEGRVSFHCDQCGICRLGSPDENFHCPRCDTCIKESSRANHVCINAPLRDAHCPICLSSMFASPKQSVFLPCGHAMHSDCFDAYVKSSYRCPICFKAMGNMHKYNKAIDAMMQLEFENMPSSHADQKVSIYCYDCRQYSTARRHYKFHKCGSSDKSCGGYNTSLC